MEALGSVPRRLGQLAIQPLGPQVRPTGASLAPGLRDSGLQGRPAGSRTHSRLHSHTGPAPRRGPGQADSAGAPHPKLRSRPMIAPHAARHTSPRDSAGTGLSNLEPAGAERGRQTGPRGGLTDRPKDG